MNVLVMLMEFLEWVEEEREKRMKFWRKKNMKFWGKKLWEKMNVHSLYKF